MADSVVSTGIGKQLCDRLAIVGQKAECGSSCGWICRGPVPRRMVPARKMDVSGDFFARLSATHGCKPRSLSYILPGSRRGNCVRRGWRWNETKIEATKEVRDTSGGDDARDFQVKESLAPARGSLPGGFAGNNSGESDPFAQTSVTPAADETQQASDNDVLVRGAKLPSEKSQPVEGEATNAENVSLETLRAEEASPAGETDLMVMNNGDTEDTILLNQVHAHILEEPKQSGSAKCVLQEQLDIRSVGLDDESTDTNLKDKVLKEHQHLEAELKYPQDVANEKYKTLTANDEQEAASWPLQDRHQNSSTDQDTFDAAQSQVKELYSRIETFEKEVNTLRQLVAVLEAKEALVEQLSGEKETLKDYVHHLEIKLTRIETEARDLKAEMQEEIELLRAQLKKLPDQSNISALILEKDLLQTQVQLLEDSLIDVEVNRGKLAAAEIENTRLQEYVGVLQARLLEASVEMREQLDNYQAEMRAFQVSLESLKYESADEAAQVPIGDMPWEFWSRLLLHIDALQLGKKLLLDDALDLRVMAWRRESRIRDTYVAVQNEKDADVAVELTKLTKLNKKPGHHVVHIAAEMAPVAKVGGLGDVITGLGKALQKKGHLVEIILPKYDCMDYSRINDLKVLDVELYSYFDGQTHKNKIWLGIVEGLPVYFIEPHHQARFFWRGRFYGESDDFKRFTYFCRAALEFLLQSGKRPDLIHTHDWQTAAVAPLYWDIYVPQGMNSARLAFTCHNFEYQGTEFPAALASCGLNVQQLHHQDRMQDNYNHSRVNLLKGGIVFSNVVTTVSPTYAQEVRQPEGGRGLHLTVAQYSKKFVGILNGIDEEAWNPATDPFLAFQFSASNLSGKYANKSLLRSRLRLASANWDGDRPLVAIITRLVPQKGVHLIRHAMYRTLERGGQFVLLGSSPIPTIQSEFDGLAKEFEHHPHARLVLKYDESLSHSIYAAADLFVIPSISEPCGLTQMISMRYGSIPVVRKTGGLADSVFDIDDPGIPEEKTNGFTFSAADVPGLNYALDRALDYYKSDRSQWENLIRKAMRMDFSWNHSADQYADLYRQCVERASAPH